MAMTEAHKAVLTRNRVALLKSIPTDSIFLGYFEAKHLLSSDNCESISKAVTTSDKVSLFLSIITRKGDIAFTTLIEALVKTNHYEVAMLIDADMAENYIVTQNNILLQPGEDQLLIEFVHEAIVEDLLRGTVDTAYNHLRTVFPGTFIYKNVKINKSNPLMLSAHVRLRFIIPKEHNTTTILKKLLEYYRMYDMNVQICKV